MPKPIQRTREEANAVARAGAAAAMRELESVGLPLTNQGQYSDLFTEFFAANLAAMKEHVQVVERDEEAKAA